MKNVSQVLIVIIFTITLIFIAKIDEASTKAKETEGETNSQNVLSIDEKYEISDSKLFTKPGIIFEVSDSRIFTKEDENCLYSMYVVKVKNISDKNLSLQKPEDILSNCKIAYDGRNLKTFKSDLNNKSFPSVIEPGEEGYLYRYEIINNKYEVERIKEDGSKLDIKEDISINAIEDSNIKVEKLNIENLIVEKIKDDEMSVVLRVRGKIKYENTFTYIKVGLKLFNKDDELAYLDTFSNYNYIKPMVTENGETWQCFDEQLNISKNNIDYNDEVARYEIEAYDEKLIAEDKYIEYKERIDEQ